MFNNRKILLKVFFNHMYWNNWAVFADHIQIVYSPPPPIDCSDASLPTLHSLIYNIWEFFFLNVQLKNCTFLKEITRKVLDSNCAQAFLEFA